VRSASSTPPVRACSPRDVLFEQDLVNHCSKFEFTGKKKRESRRKRHADVLLYFYSKVYAAASPAGARRRSELTVVDLSVHSTTLLQRFLLSSLYTVLELLAAPNVSDHHGGLWDLKS